MVKIEINRLNDAFLMEAVNEAGNTVRLDASTDSGGSNQGMRPMQLLLAALGACGSFDVIAILKKQKQDLKDIKIIVTGERENKVPAVYTEAHIHFKLYGKLDPEKAKRAVDLAVEKYCSVGETMKPLTKITHDFEIIDQD
ncbi:MAG: osmotically inducible protein C [Bacteroidota bacterium]|nr:MAG: OsmC family protein [Bacteroidetes bacterium OLB12]MCE7864677.1 OsmC family peroxiredoxin [Bacteroidetes bacterium CHB5]GIL24064.1 MAG: osmotically inducible protein C [Bacteroidota bacterium]HNU43448.1 OsmC family protein [Cyclobacteriaceae bacterium]